jgi:hypothetical protein
MHATPKPGLVPDHARRLPSFHGDLAMVIWVKSRDQLCAGRKFRTRSLSSNVD